MDRMDNFIRAKRKALGLTEQQLADRVGVSRGTVQHWERPGGTAPNRNRQAKVAEALGITMGELLAGLASGQLEPNIQLRSGESEAQMLTIAAFDARSSTGRDLVLQEQPGVIKGWVVSEEWVQKNARGYTSPQNLVIVTGFGDSMRGLFNPGDPLLVDAGVKKVDHDGVYFFRVGDEGFVKRLQRIPGEGMIAISENKAYRDWTIRPDMDFEVFGRVLRAWKGEDF